MARPKKGVTFWDRVAAGTLPPDERGCRIWTGHVNDDGYGRINRDGRLVYIHRAICERDHGPLPAGHEACHTCDRPACLEPSHLFPGTHAENMADCARKGRKLGRAGSRNPAAKLDEMEVALIKIQLGAGHRLADLGREFGVKPETIGAIKAGRIWRHVALP